MGEGWSWIQRPAPRRTTPQTAREGWEQIKRDLAAETYRLYVLDEFTYPMNWGWVDVDEVVATLRDRPGHPARGHHRPRRRPASWSTLADLVTEMTKVKHPMDAGQKGQRGIEW